MSTALPVVDRRLAALFAAALTGVVVVVGLVLATWTAWALIPYVAVALLAAAQLVRRAAAAQADARRAGGRTCQCCTSTVHDPVRVV